MVFIFAEFGLLGKSFFELCGCARVERVEFGVDGVDTGEETIGRNFFADTFTEVASEKAVAAFVKVADVFCKSGASFNECVEEFDFGDFHGVYFLIFCVRLQGLFLQFRKLFAELAQAIEQNSRLIVQHRIDQVLCDLFDFCGEGLDLDFFFCHAFNVSQPRKNAMKNFSIVQSFFVDEKKFFDLAHFLKVVLCKWLIFNGLRRAAGRSPVSR
jgi:hypothetical protein